MHKCGITAEQAADGRPDLVWLRAGGGEAHWYGGGDRLPIGVEAFAGREHNDRVLWVDRVGAMIIGDTVVDFRAGPRKWRATRKRRAASAVIFVNVTGAIVPVLCL
jgi:hypothetical protein